MLQRYTAAHKYLSAMKRPNKTPVNSLLPVQQCGNMELCGAKEEYTSGFGYVENTC